MNIFIYIMASLVIPLTFASYTNNFIFRSKNKSIISFSLLLRNVGYKCIIFKEKWIPKMIRNKIYRFKQNYSGPLFVLNKYAIDYNGIAEEEKTLIETVISGVL